MTRALAPILLAVLLGGCQQAEGAADSQAAPSPAYRAVAVGRIDSASEARQLVAAVDGVIEQVAVARGDRIVAGQTLLRIACGPRDAGIRSRAALAEQASADATTVALGSRNEAIAAARQAALAARAARDDAADRLEQARGLVDKGFVSRREFDARAHALAGAEAQLARAEAEAALVTEGPRHSERAAAQAAARAAGAETGVARALAAQCTLASPVDGTVLQVLRREGEFSGASQGVPLIVVGDLSRRIVRAEINERDAASVAPGQRATIWIEGQPQRWHGRIAQLASVMGRRSARSLDPTDRFDRDVREALIEFDNEAPPPLVGLRVMVGIAK